MALWLCILAIVISILVGWKYKLNTGIIAMGFAFVIGICVMGMKASTSGRQPLYFTCYPFLCSLTTQQRTAP